MGQYQTRLITEQKAQQDAIASRIAPGKGNLSLDTAMKRMEAIERPVDKVETEAGSLKFRPMPRLKIISEADIPRSYMVPDEALIFADLKAGKVIPGAEIEIIQVPVNSRA